MNVPDSAGGSAAFHDNRGQLCAAPERRGWTARYGLALVLGVLLLLNLSVVIEQGRTIDAQRTLIRSLFQDSAELSAAKMREVKARSDAYRQEHSQSSAPPDAVQR